MNISSYKRPSGIYVSCKITVACLVLYSNNRFNMKFINAHQKSGCNVVKSAHKDTKFSALVQKWSFLYNLKTTSQTMNYGSLWNL